MRNTPYRPEVFSILGIPIHRKLRTGEAQVPWSSVFILSLMWFTFGFHIFAGGQALTFTIYRYTNDPRIISLIMTVAGLIMIGPMISYLSDQVWTRHGRRRPFLFVAWLGGMLGMYSFAFLPQVIGGINRMLGCVGIPPIGDLVILLIIVLCYQKMLAGLAPLEPLFLECVPPHQRGRFFAIRGILFTLAVTFFYQLLWPIYDDRIDLFGYLGHPGILQLKGEQLVYIFSGSMFFITGFYLLFCVEETRVPDAPNMRFSTLFLGNRAGKKEAGPDRAERPRFSETLRNIPIVTFVAGFFKNVFLKRENYPYYIVLVIPAMESAVWGNFGALMGNMQFGYSKPNQALYALPLQIMSIMIVTPFAGWYSDVRVNIRWWLRIVMLAVSVACFTGMIRMFHLYSPADIRELPEIWVLFAITALIVGGVAFFYIPLVETLLDRTGREHARVWVSVVAVVKSMLTVIALYIWIRCSPDRVPPIMIWMAFAVLGGTFDALMKTFIGPMIYDYMPRSQMGTINSGSGIYQNLLNFGVANLGAWWVVFYSVHFHKPSNVPYDYTSMYLLQFLFFIPTILAKIYFVRLVMTGRLTKRGVLELEEARAREELKQKLQEEEQTEVLKAMQAGEGP